MHSFILMAIAQTFCASGKDDETLKLRQLMTQEASHYSSCTVDEDCTFFTQVGGYVINKSGLTYVNSCSRELKKRILPPCPNDSSGMPGKFAIDQLSAEQIPSRVVCREKKCVGIFDNQKPPLWFTDNGNWMAAHRVYPRLDKHCQKLLDSLQKNSK